MNYREFIKKINDYISRANAKLEAEFSCVDGKYTAKCDGIVLTGNSRSKKITVMFGDGHIAMATL